MNAVERRFNEIAMPFFSESKWWNDERINVFIHKR